MKGKDNSFILIQTGGASNVDSQPLFSSDNRFLFCLSEKLVKVYSTDTGRCVQILHGHHGTVTSMSIHPSIKLQLLSCSLDKTVKIWDYEDGVLLSTYYFKYPLTALHAPLSCSKLVFLSWKDGTRTGLSNFKLDDTRKFDCKDLADSKYAQIDIVKPLHFSRNYFIVPSLRMFTVYTDFIHSDKPFNKKLVHNIGKGNDDRLNITCMACHPTKEQCVTGHKNGMIRVWYQICSAKHVTHHINHWHSLSVLAVCFSPLATQLLSGGHESTLVIWGKDSKDFLPRLGEPITHISTSSDGSLYATCHTDNTVLIITNYSTVKQSIQGFVSVNHSRDISCGLQFDPVTKACVTNGKPGHLIFYDIQDDLVLYNLDIVSRNFISSSDLDKLLSRTLVTKVALITIGQDHHLMATAEFDIEDHKDQKLKFWKYDISSKNWVLDTVIASPHDNINITSLQLHSYPSYTLCVSTSDNGLFKIWIKGIDATGWSCSGILSYRECSCLDSSFSEDGSIIAVAFDENVCLYQVDDFDNVVLLLSHIEKIMHLEFGRGSCCHLLMVASSNHLQCWDILTGSVVWSTKLKIQHLIPDQFSENLAVFTKTNCYVICPSSEIPLFSSGLNNIIVTGAGFFPVSHRNSSIDCFEKSQLFMVSNKMTVHTFASVEEMDEKVANAPHSLSQIQSLQTPMSSLLQVQSNTHEEKASAAAMSLRHSTVHDALKSILSCPPHVMPPLHTVTDKFITSLILDGGSVQNDQNLDDNDIITNNVQGFQEESSGRNSSYKTADKSITLPKSYRPCSDDFLFLFQ